MRYSDRPHHDTLPQRPVFIPLKDLLVFPDGVVPVFLLSDDALTLFRQSILEFPAIRKSKGPMRSLTFCCVGFRESSRTLKLQGKACFD